MSPHAHEVTFAAPDPACVECERLTVERDHWRSMYEAMRAAAKAGIASKITQRTEK